MRDKNKTKNVLNEEVYSSCDLESETNIFEDQNEEYKDEAPSSNEPNGPETKNGIISNAQLVNIRKDPSLESEKVGVLSIGTNVTIIRKINDFYKILTDKNEEGYVYSKYVEEE